MIEFFESVVGTFRITQPGSSVATSLVAGEAVCKKVGILDIQGKNFRLHPVPLTQVRSFVTTEVSLREHRDELDADDPKIDQRVSQILEEEVKLMVLQGHEKMQQVREDAKAAGSNAGEEDCPLKYKLAKPDQVLVRIRVEHSGFTSLNSQRFGAKFVGEVANPDDVLLFHRKKEANMHSKASKKRTSMQKPIAPEELERTNMEDLVKELLGAPEQKLRLLSEPTLSIAMEEFVDKSMAQSIPDAAKEMLECKQKKLIDRGGAGKGDSGDVVGKRSQVREEFDRAAEEDDDALNDEQQEGQKASKSTNKRKKRTSSSEQEKTEDVTGKENHLAEESAPAARSAARSSAKTSRAAPKTSERSTARRRKLVGLDDDDDFDDNNNNNNIDDDDDDDLMEVEKAPKARPSARPKRAAPKRPVNYSQQDDGDDSDAVIELDDDDDDDDDIEVVEKPKKKASRKKAAPKKAAARKTTTSGSARKSKSTSKPQRRSLDDSDDDDFDQRGPAGTAEIDDDWGTAPTRSEI